MPYNTDSLFFNPIFLRSLLLIPLLFLLVVLVQCYKQYKEKFQGRSLFIDIPTESTELPE